MRTSPPPQLPIFRSELQAQLLALLLADPAPSVGVPELSERLEAPRASVYREIQRLVAAGILERHRIGRNTEYRADQASPLVEPLRTLIDRTMGIERELRSRLETVDGIEAAAIFGSYAAGEQRGDSDVDVLVIGDPDRDGLERQLRVIEAKSGREINAQTYGRDEWVERARSGSGFASTVLSRPMITLFGDLPGSDR